MQPKTSVMPSEELIHQAVRDFLAARAKRTRAVQDLEILNRRAETLNVEAEDVLLYQVDL